VTTRINNTASGRGTKPMRRDMVSRWSENAYRQHNESVNQPINYRTGTCLQCLIRDNTMNQWINQSITGLVRASSVLYQTTQHT